MYKSTKFWEFLLSSSSSTLSSNINKEEESQRRLDTSDTLSVHSEEDSENLTGVVSLPEYLLVQNSNSGVNVNGVGYGHHNFNYNYIFNTNSDENGRGMGTGMDDQEWDMKSDQNNIFYGEFESSILPPLSTTNFLDNISGIGGIGGTDSGPAVDESGIDGGESADGPGVYFNISWTSVLVMTMLVVVTIVGNVLVCLSVVLVRKLRKPQNYLLVSLAVSDLFVAIFVMPFAILMEFYHSNWPLNSGLCDFWVSADVLCCTASILNLCAISLDRFQAITAPFDYSARSTPRRMLAVIFIVWLGSACVSLPPLLLLGNEYVDSTGVPICSVSQNFWYQIYATMASFYIPLGVMVVVYAKILRVVTDKKKEMNWKKKKNNNCSLQVPPPTLANDSCNSSLANQPTMMMMPLSGNQVSSGSLQLAAQSQPVAATTMLNRKTSVDMTAATIALGAKSHSQPPPKSSSSSIESSSASIQSQSQLQAQSQSHPMTILNTSSGGGSMSKVRLTLTQRKSRGSLCSAISGVHLPGSDSPPGIGPGASGFRKRSKSTCVERFSGNGSGASGSGSGNGNGDHDSEYKSVRSQLNKESWDKEYLTPSPSYSTTNTPVHRIRRSLIPCVTGSTPNRRKNRLFSGLKEHKASTTLGIIMSAFIICWLPFFVLALFRPIFHMDIPDWISSLFNWLGYANSALNPVIYATLNRDFRRPFREILSFRCATLDSLMRKEFYLEQYGEDNTDNPRNKASVTLIFLENGNISEPLL